MKLSNSQIDVRKMRKMKWVQPSKTHIKHVLNKCWHITNMHLGQIGFQSTKRWQAQLGTVPSHLLSFIKHLSDSKCVNNAHVLWLCPFLQLGRNKLWLTDLKTTFRRKTVITAIWGITEQCYQGAKRVGHDTHTQSQRSESSSNSMRLLIVFHEEMKRGEIHLHLIKGFSVFLDSTLLLFMTSCPCAARFISGMGGTASSCMPYIYTARANWHDTLPCAHSNYIHWRLLKPDRAPTIKMAM